MTLVEKAKDLEESLKKKDKGVLMVGISKEPEYLYIYSKRKSKSYPKTFKKIKVKIIEI